MFSVVSVALTSFRSCSISSLRTSLRTTGVMFSAFWRLWSSSSRIQPFAAITLEVEKSRPTSMSPFSSASTVSGPPTSSGTNSPNSIPYTSRSPGMQNGRSGHSGGPPRVSCPATGARSLTEARPCSSAVSAVTTNAFVSLASADSKRVWPRSSSRGSSVDRASSGSPDAVASGSRNSSSELRYSGAMSISPASMAGWSTSRDSRPVCRSTVKPAFSSTCAYISATIWFSAKATPPTVRVPRSSPPPPPPPPPDPSSPHAAAIRATARRAAPRAGVRDLRMGHSPLSLHRSLPSSLPTKDHQTLPIRPEFPVFRAISGGRAGHRRRFGDLPPPPRRGPGADGPLEQSQGDLGEDGQKRNQKGPSEDLGVVPGGEAVEDEPAQAAPADDGGQRGCGHHLDRGRPDPPHDQGSGQRQLKPAQHLAFRQPHAPGRLQGVGVDALDAHVRVREDRRNR